MRVWNSRNSVQSKLIKIRFFRLRTSLAMTAAMPSATSIRSLQVKRQARLMALLAVIGPARLRPIWARLGRSHRMAAATRTARVLDWLGRKRVVAVRTQMRIDSVDTVAPSSRMNDSVRRHTDCLIRRVGRHCVLGTKRAVGMTQGAAGLSKRRGSVKLVRPGD